MAGGPAFDLSPATQTKGAGCPRFASVLWTITWARCELYAGRLAVPALPRLSTRCVANLGHLAWLALRMPHSSQKEGLNGPPSKRALVAMSKSKSKNKSFLKK